MGVTVSVEIHNTTTSPIMNVHSVSGDFSLCGQIKEQFLKTDQFSVPEIAINTKKVYQFSLCPMPPVILVFYMPGPWAKLAGVGAITVLQYVEPPLNLRIEYEDGSVDDVYFAVRVFNTRNMSFDPKDTIETFLQLDVDKALACIAMIPVMTLADIVSGGIGDFGVTVEEFDKVDRDCRRCMMKVAKNSIDHTWNFYSVSSTDTTQLIFNDTKFNYGLALTQEMRNKAKRQMQRNRFMECIQQLLAAMAMSMSKVMTDSLSDNVQQAVGQTGHELLDAALKYEQDPMNSITSDFYFKKALECFEAAKLLNNSPEANKHYDHVIKAIKLKLQGNINYRDAYDLEEKANGLSIKATKSKKSNDHQQAADKAIEAQNSYRKANDNFTQAMQYHPGLGYLQAITVRNIEKQDERARKHLGLSLKNLVKDLKFDMAASEAMQWDGAELLEIHADVGKRKKSKK